jgi:DNA polymerase-3 subunit beta
MNFTVNVNKFRSHVAMITPVIGKSFLPILNNVLIVADNNTIRLTGMNAAQSIHTSFECRCTPGTCTVPARKLLQILDSLPQDDNVTFDADDKAVATLLVPSGKFTLLGSPAEDYPETICDLTGKATVIAAENINGMIELCKNAVNKDEKRPQLAGMFLEFTADKTTAVATDGKRMAIYSVPAENGDATASFIIPPTALGFISKLSGDLEFGMVDQSLVVKGANMTVVTKLIAGQYPDYQRVVPRSFKDTIEVNGDALATAVKLVSTVTEVNQMIVMNFEKDVVTLSANSSSIGSASHTISLERGISEPCEISINPAFLLNAINGNKDSIFIKLNDSLSPMIVGCGEEAFTVIMPLRRK